MKIQIFEERLSKAHKEKFPKFPPKITQFDIPPEIRYRKLQKPSKSAENSRIDLVIVHRGFTGDNTLHLNFCSLIWFHLTSLGISSGMNNQSVNISHNYHAEFAKGTVLQLFKSYNLSQALVMRTISSSIIPTTNLTTN